jgi:hypothetical protein
MDTRIRRGGKVEKIVGQASVSLDRRDIAHIKFGSVRYFMLFVNPPEIVMERSGPRDPLVAWLMLAGMLLYFLVIPALWMSTPKKEAPEENEIFEIVIIEPKNFNGYWIGTFKQTKVNQTAIEFKEVITISNPFFRTISYVFVDLDKTMNLYLQNLKQKLVE